jgi:hypothetical protein
MFMSTFLVFVGGWLLWFWIDKPPAGRYGLPPPGDSMVQNFQTAIDLLKAGYPDIAFLFIWHAHYLVISVLTGILLALTFRAISDRLGRRRSRGLYHPHPGGAAPLRAVANSAPERQVSSQAGASAAQNTTPGDDTGI